jgi:hypothetical protein
MDPCNVFIIGGVTTRHLAPPGKCVLRLECGDWLLRKPPLAPACRHEERDRGDEVCASGRRLLLRHGSGHLGVKHRLWAHKFDNLYVVDTNVSNLALTAMADALSVGDQLLSQLA